MVKLESFALGGNKVYPGTSVTLPSGWRGQRTITVTLSEDGEMVHFVWRNRGRVYREQWFTADEATDIESVTW